MISPSFAAFLFGVVPYCDPLVNRMQLKPLRAPSCSSFCQKSSSIFLQSTTFPSPPRRSFSCKLHQVINNEATDNGRNMSNIPYAPPKATLVNAKYNYKYRMGEEKRGKKKNPHQRPRLNQDDINFYNHFVQGSGVSFDYDPSTNNIIFQPSSSSSTIGTESNNDHNRPRRSVEIDGFDTGGQVIRFLLNWSIREYGKYPSSLLQTYTARTKGKGIMLYVQAALLRLQVGESFTVIGGNPYNPDGPSPDFLKQKLFPILQEMLGISFQLFDESTPNRPKFTLFRDQSIEVATNDSSNSGSDKWESNEIHSTEMVDQLLMMIGYYYDYQDYGNHQNSSNKNKPKEIVLKCKMTPTDYHVDAMIKVLRQVCGYEIKDTKSSDGDGPSPYQPPNENSKLDQRKICLLNEIAKEERRRTEL